MTGPGSAQGRSDEFIGFSGTGVFNQTGGTNTCNGNFNIAGDSQSEYTSKASGNGIYNLSKGLLSVTPMAEWVGDVGVELDQTGGTNTTYDLYVGGGVSGTYNLNAGLLQTNFIHAAGGTFNFTAGMFAGNYRLVSRSYVQLLDHHGWHCRQQCGHGRCQWPDHDAQ